MTKKAAALVAGAKQWASYYGDYANGVEGAVFTAPLRVRAAWEANDADAFAELFIENGSMLAGDTQLVSREQIREYMAEAFGGAYKGSRLTVEPREIRMLTDSVAVAVSEGGVIHDGATSLEAADNVRTMWVAARLDGDWRIVSYQTSPIAG
jgi:uncharacterized protein (TIGR02246 family)